jgi:glucans biosynthesis protein C
LKGVPNTLQVIQVNSQGDLIMEKQGIIRRYDLDWIKVIATMFVFLYHCSMFFNPFDWHVKNDEVDSTVILAFSLLAGSWIMPVFFVISGISSNYSLQKRSMGLYMRERFVRLGIPLLFGIFILAPPQIYIERVDNGQFTGSFFAFLPQAFNGLYLEIGGTGNFAFVGLHLWYLLALILFSLITLHLFYRTTSFKTITAVHLFVIQIIVLLGAAFLKTVNLGGWDLLVYLLFFLAGYYVFSSSQLLVVLRRTFPIHMALGVLAAPAYTVWFLNGMPAHNSGGFLLFTSLLAISSLNSILAFYYLANKYLSFTNRVLRYCSEASLPFYILHQPVIVIIGFFIKDLSWSLPVKSVLLVVLSFLIISSIYHFMIRHISILRVLFGLKRKKRIIPVSSPAKPNTPI